MTDTIDRTAADAHPPMPHFPPIALEAMRRPCREALARLPPGMRILRFAKGETIYTPEKLALNCYRVLEGQVEIRSEHCEVPDRIGATICGPNEVFGETAALAGKRRASRAVAAENVVCMVYSTAAFAAAILDDRLQAIAYARTVIARHGRAKQQILSKFDREAAQGAKYAGSSIPLQSAVMLAEYVAEVFEILETDQNVSIAFARTLVRSLTTSASEAEIRVDWVA